MLGAWEVDTGPRRVGGGQKRGDGGEEPPALCGAPFLPQKTLHAYGTPHPSLPSQHFARLLRDAYGGRVAFVVDCQGATSTNKEPV
jgi:hypothetical protein